MGNNILKYNELYNNYKELKYRGKEFDGNIDIGFIRSLIDTTISMLYDEDNPLKMDYIKELSVLNDKYSSVSKD